MTASTGGQRDRAKLGWPVANRALKRKHVTLQVLRREYFELQHGSYRRSRLCETNRAREGRLTIGYLGHQSGLTRALFSLASLELVADVVPDPARVLTRLLFRPLIRRLMRCASSSVGLPFMYGSGVGT